MATLTVQLAAAATSVALALVVSRAALALVLRATFGRASTGASSR
jgi:hypothetical protein